MYKGLIILFALAADLCHQFVDLAVAGSDLDGLLHFGQSLVVQVDRFQTKSPEIIGERADRAGSDLEYIQLDRLPLREINSELLDVFLVFRHAAQEDHGVVVEIHDRPVGISIKIF